MRVGLLLCDFMPDEFAKVAGSYEHMFSSMFSGHDVSLFPFEAFNGDLPTDPMEYDGYVISGSRASVYEDQQWIRDLERFIRSTATVSVPVFGVCFGLQVMAQAFGGTVEKASGGWGGGVRTVDVSERRRWMADTTTAVSLIMSHQDQVVVLPTGASLLGSSDHCTNFLVEFTPRHIGIQGHPEFEPPFAEAVYANRREAYGELVDEALISLGQPTDSETVVTWICEILDVTGGQSQRIC
jgi:GMP synthase-like glutamine amidotransferase